MAGNQENTYMYCSGHQKKTTREKKWQKKKRIQLTWLLSRFSLSLSIYGTIYIHIVLDRRIESLCRMATTLLGNFLLGTWERFQYGLTILKPIIMSKHTYNHTYTTLTLS